MRLLVCPVLVCLGACAVPATTQSLSGIAMNSAALVALNKVSDDSLGSHYRYACQAGMEEVLWAIQEAIQRANDEALFAGSSPGRVPGRGIEANAAPPRPRKQRTPVPYFEIDSGLSRADADSVVYVISHRRGRRVSFIATPGRVPGTVGVEIMPYELSGGLPVLSTDDSQRNAAEDLHERFYMTARELDAPGEHVCRRELVELR
ncbi:MAG: hypothetical protein ACE5FP_09610 [Gemmatimonadota bacterium]